MKLKYFKLIKKQLSNNVYGCCKFLCKKCDRHLAVCQLYVFKDYGESLWLNLVLIMFQVYLSAWVCSETLAQRPSVQAGGCSVQGGSTYPNRARQGQEPLAQCRLALWCAITGKYYIYYYKVKYCIFFA